MLRQAKPPADNRHRSCGASFARSASSHPLPDQLASAECPSPRSRYVARQFRGDLFQPQNAYGVGEYRYLWRRRSHPVAYLGRDHRFFGGTNRYSISLHDLLSDVGIASGADDVESIRLGAAFVAGTRMDKLFATPKFQPGRLKRAAQYLHDDWNDFCHRHWLEQQCLLYAEPV